MRRSLVSKLQDALVHLGRDLVFTDIAAELISKNLLAHCEYQAVLTAPTDRGRAEILVDILAGKEDAAFYIFIDVLRIDYPWLADQVIRSHGVEDVTDSAAVQSHGTTRDNITNGLVESSRIKNGRKRESSPPIIEKPPKQTQCHNSRVTEVKVPLVHFLQENTTGDQHKTTNKNTKPREVVQCKAPKTKNGVVEIHDKKTVPEIICLENHLDRDDKKLSQCVTDEMMTLLRKNHRACRDWTSLAHALGLSKLVNKIRVKALVFGEDWDICVVHLLQEWVGEQPQSATVLNLLRALRTEGFNDVADELVEKFCT